MKFWLMLNKWIFFSIQINRIFYLWSALKNRIGKKSFWNTYSYREKMHTMLFWNYLQVGEMTKCILKFFFRITFGTEILSKIGAPERAWIILEQNTHPFNHHKARFLKSKFNIILFLKFSFQFLKAPFSLALWGF